MHYEYRRGETVLTERNGSRIIYQQDEKLRNIRTIYHDSQDRQQIHEVIREASMDATAKMKNGEHWDLAAALAANPAFGMTAEEPDSCVQSNSIPSCNW